MLWPDPKGCARDAADQLAALVRRLRRHRPELWENIRSRLALEILTETASLLLWECSTGDAPRGHVLALAAERLSRAAGDLPRSVAEDIFAHQSVLAELAVECRVTEGPRSLQLVR